MEELDGGLIVAGICVLQIFVVSGRDFAVLY